MYSIVETYSLMFRGRNGIFFGNNQFFNIETADNFFNTCIEEIYFLILLCFLRFSIFYTFANKQYYFLSTVRNLLTP